MSLNYATFIEENFFGLERDIIKENDYIEALVKTAAELEYWFKENMNEEKFYEGLIEKPARIVSNIRALMKETIMPELTQLGYSIQEQQKDIEKFYCNKNQGWVMKHLHFGKGYAKVENEEGKKVHKFNTIEKAMAAAQENDISIITATNSGFTLRLGTINNVYKNPIKDYKAGMYSIVYYPYAYKEEEVEEVEEPVRKPTPPPRYTKTRSPTPSPRPAHSLSPSPSPEPKKKYKGKFNVKTPTPPPTPEPEPVEEEEESEDELEVEVVKFNGEEKLYVDTETGRVWDIETSNELKYLYIENIELPVEEWVVMDSSGKKTVPWQPK